MNFEYSKGEGLRDYEGTLLLGGSSPISLFYFINSCFFVFDISWVNCNFGPSNLDNV